MIRKQKQDYFPWEEGDLFPPLDKQNADTVAVTQLEAVHYNHKF